MDCPEKENCSEMPVLKGMEYNPAMVLPSARSPPLASGVSRVW